MTATTSRWAVLSNFLGPPTKAILWPLSRFAQRSFPSLEPAHTDGDVVVGALSERPGDGRFDDERKLSGHRRIVLRDPNRLSDALSLRLSILLTRNPSKQFAKRSHKNE